MNKSDLKTGMYVEDRLGNKMRFIEKCFIEEGLTIIKYGAYKEDLTEIDGNTGFDIMKVFDNNRKLIWERQEVDWTKVAIDTKVWVREDENADWLPRHYAGYSNGLYCTYPEGYTSFTTAKGKLTVIRWNQCKLAEEPQELKKEVTLEDLREKHNKEHQKHSCTRCYYNKYDENCMFAWLLDNYNVTEK